MRVGASCMTVIRELSIRDLIKVCGEQVEAWMEKKPEVRSEYITGDHLFKRVEDEWMEDEEPGVENSSVLAMIVDIVPKFARLMVSDLKSSLKKWILNMPIVSLLRMVYGHKVRIIPETYHARI